MVIGVGFMYLITLGNSDFSNRCLGFGATVISMAFIVVVSALAFQYEVDTFFFSTSKVEAEEAVYYVSFVTGILLLLVQLVQVLRMLFPGGWHSRWLDILVPSPVILEKRTKQAAEYKVCRLIRRSLSCHQQSNEDTAPTSSTPINYRRLNAVRMHGQTTRALNMFHEQSRERRTIGSLWWIADSFLKGNSLAWQEGLWISPRLLWANLSQWFVICSTLVIQSVCVRWLQTLEDPITEGLTLSGYVLASEVCRGQISRALTCLTLSRPTLQSAIVLERRPLCLHCCAGCNRNKLHSIRYPPDASVSRWCPRLALQQRLQRISIIARFSRLPVRLRVLGRSAYRFNRLGCCRIHNAPLRVGCKLLLPRASKVEALMPETNILLPSLSLPENGQLLF